MIDFNTALNILLSNSVISDDIEKINLINSPSRVLATDICTQYEMPPFDKSAVDGYACRFSDLDRSSFEILEVIAAGDTPKYPISEGCCSKIMTGAPLPNGADIVIMVEDCCEADGKMTINKNWITEGGHHIKSNICTKGEDVGKDQILLKKGKLIKPQDVAIAAACGVDKLDVFKKIKVGIISTGSELVEPGSQNISFGKIYNSNSWQLISLITTFGGDTTYYGIAADNIEDTELLLSRAVNDNQVVILSGGVSEGDFDFVPVIMKKMGFKILFDRVAVQPGKPTTFAKNKEKYIFGLPGNPVSAFVQTILLVKPFLLSLQGAFYQEKCIKLPISSYFRRKSGSRLSHIPVKINSDGTFTPIEYNGSAHISALSDSDALARIPIGIFELNIGETADIILL